MICSLVYIGWIIHVGSNEISRINGQYRRIVARLDADRIESTALEELISECRRESKVSPGHKERDCLSWPQGVIEAKGKEIEKRLLRIKKRGIIKVVLFYAGFVIIFLLGPPLFIYLLLAGMIKLYRSIKIIR